MIGLDARYNFRGLKFAAQLYYTTINNSEQYNVFAAKNNVLNDLGSSMIGYYTELGYNVFKVFPKLKSELIPFVRYEAYNTHNTVAANITKNKKYDNTIITSGLTYVLEKGMVLKSDIQFIKSRQDSKFNKVFNAGFGVMF